MAVLTARKEVFLALMYAVLAVKLSCVPFLCLDSISLYISLRSLCHQGLAGVPSSILEMAASAAPVIASVIAKLEHIRQKNEAPNTFQGYSLRHCCQASHENTKHVTRQRYLTYGGKH